MFDEAAGEFLIAQTKRVRRKLLDITYTIARSPFSDSDYVLPDELGRPVSHVITEGYVITYWVDAPVKHVVILEIERG